VGLGYIAQNAVLPAFRHAARRCELAALVSGDAVKRRTLARKYGVSHAWSYDDFDDALASDTFDAVYLAVPNHLHRDYAVRAARAHKHVLCEKPMALSVPDCDAMIRAANDNDVRLMVAYRLHLDPVNLYAVDVALSGRIGEVQSFVSSFGMAVKRDTIRTQRKTGGGTLWDIGIYCINAARYLFRDEPNEVFSWATDVGRPSFRDVEESTACTLRFPSGRLATFWTGFTSADIATYSLIGSKGHLRVDGAYEYHEPRHTTLTIDAKTIHRRHRMQDQFAAELDYFAECVRRRATPVPSGLEGRADVAIIQALYASAASGRPVRLREAAPPRRPDPKMAMAKPPVRREPPLVRAQRPHY
jgi:glucose-fructose oxidoreductase